jgi:hypothetical protein
MKGVATTAFLSGLGLLISVAVGPSLPDAFQEDALLGLIVTAFFLMCLLMGLGCAIAVAAEVADVVMGRAQSATGPARVRTEGLTTYALARPLPIPYTYPGQYTHHLEVAGNEYTIDRELYELLAVEVGEVKVYFAAHSGELLSLELLA